MKGLALTAIALAAIPASAHAADWGATGHYTTGTAFGSNFLQITNYTCVDPRGATCTLVDSTDTRDQLGSFDFDFHREADGTPFYDYSFTLGSYSFAQSGVPYYYWAQGRYFDEHNRLLFFVNGEKTDANGVTTQMDTRLDGDIGRDLSVHGFVASGDIYTNTLVNGVLHYNRVNYTFRFTEGSGTITSVGAILPTPEPATWAMMLSGFGLLGWTVRKRKLAYATVIS